MFCSKCGTKNDDNAFKCLKCGTILQDATTAYTPAKQRNTVLIVLIVVGAVFIFFAVMGILAAIAIPQFVTYRQRAYDAQAQARIYSACQSAHLFFLEHPEQTITLSDLEELDAAASPEVELIIEDGTREHLVLTARHKNSETMFMTDSDCNIQEMAPMP